MRELTRQQVVSFLHELGGLHDVRLTSMQVNPNAGTIRFDVNDFYWNSESLPEYPGAFAGSLIFSRVSQIDMRLERFIDGDWILDFNCDVAESRCVVETMGGKVSFVFEVASVPENVYQWTQAQST